MTSAQQRPEAMPEPDVVELLLHQHGMIRDLFTEVERSTGAERRDAFRRLVRLLAVHETAEEQVIHPLARRTLPGGEGLVDDRLAEERRAKEMLAQLDDMDPDDPRFLPMLSQLRDAVIAHAVSEEQYEFRYLRQQVKPEQMRRLASAVRAAQALVPAPPSRGGDRPGEPPARPGPVGFRPGEGPDQQGDVEGVEAGLAGRRPENGLVVVPRGGHGPVPVLSRTSVPARPARAVACPPTVWGQGPLRGSGLSTPC